MRLHFSKILTRESLSSNEEIWVWWNTGRGLLNGLALIYTIVHLATIVIVFRNGWIVFLLPIIFWVFIAINLLFSFGLLVELIALRIFKSKIDFTRIAPEIKKWELVLIAVLILFLSIVDIVRNLYG